MLILQQMQTCKYAWKQVFSIHQSLSFLIKQSNQHKLQKLNHQAKVPAVIILTAVVVQKVIRPGQVIAKAKIPLRKKLKTKIKVDGFVCSHRWGSGILQVQKQILSQNPKVVKQLMSIAPVIGTRLFLQEWVLNLEETNKGYLV